MRDFLFPFEKLHAWTKARVLVKDIYAITKNFPAEEKFGLVSQVRRASISIISNIAEGSSRITPKEQARFYEMSYSSATEVLSQLIISNDLGFIDEKNYLELRQKLQEVTLIINGLRKSKLEISQKPNEPNPF